ncbi:nuclear transport factor 2 family protein [Agrobacterium sp. T29]|uniref:nuclear transport factor 2 family protein n=1 Tax=Agrobacterium sp. T29 TaxID=2580515 RepID=UPI00143DAB72|nr:nuclear transport factor 2 family protein [Agrobacterium sp. T29]
MKLDYSIDREIRNLISQYCYMLDTHRLADLSRLFAGDGIWTTHYGEAQGPTAIEQLLIRLIPQKPSRKHFVANTILTEGEDCIIATSYYLVVRESDAGPIVSVAGTYHDTIIWEDGWKFRHRRLQQDITGDLGLAPGAIDKPAG